MSHGNFFNWSFSSYSYTTLLETQVQIILAQFTLLELSFSHGLRSHVSRFELTLVNIETLISFAVVNERLNKVVLNRIRVIVIIIWIALVVPNFVLIGQILTGAPQLTGFLASISYWVSVLGPGLFLVCDNAQSVYLIYALKKLKNIKQGFRDIVLILVIQIILDWVSFICAFLGLHLPKGTLLHVTNQVYVAASGGFHTFLSITAFYHLRVIALTKSKILTAKRAPVGRSEHRPSHISFQVSNHPKSPSPTRFTIDTVK